MNICLLLVCAVSPKLGDNLSGLVFTKGLGQVLGLNLVLLYRAFKPKSFVNMGPG